MEIVPRKASRPPSRYVASRARYNRDGLLSRTWSTCAVGASTRRWLNRLERLGYKHSEQVLDSADFGVPQSRKRLFIVCDRDQEPPEIVPPGRQLTRSAATILVPNGAYAFVPLKTERRAPRTLQSAEKAIIAIGRDESFLIVYYGTDGGGGWQSLDVPLRTVTTLDRFALVTPTKDGHQMRMLQVPELRKAMGFPPSFKLAHGTRRDQIKMLGNGVCPPVMRAIVRALTRNRVEGGA